MSDRKREIRTRIDNAHPSANASPAPASVPERSPVELEAIATGRAAGVSAIDHIDRHAQDIGQQLAAQQRELDRRESEFNAALALMEKEFREARLIQQERESLLEAKLSELDRRSLEVDEIVADAHHDHQIAAADGHFASLDEREQSQDMKLAADRWRKRLRELEESERLLQSQVSQLDYDTRQVREQRSRQEAELTEQIGHLHGERETEKGRLEAELLRIRQREQEHDRREAALDQLHADISRMYREAIELQLCTKQLWGELNDSADSAELTGRIAELRRKLMEQFQLSEQRIADQQSRLEHTVDKLCEHQQTVEDQRSEVREWVIRRNREIEADAARLLERERELNRELADKQFNEREWAIQRSAYEQEIRRLRRLVRH